MYVVDMYLFLRGLSLICTEHMEQLVFEMFVFEASGGAEFLTRRYSTVLFTALGRAVEALLGRC